MEACLEFELTQGGGGNINQERRQKTKKDDLPVRMV